MTEEAPCKFLEWDSDFFGRRIGRMTVPRLTEATVRSAAAWSRANRVECLYFLGDADDPQTVRIAEGHGFGLVDVRITLDTQLDDGGPPAETSTSRCVIRPSRADDISALREIAQVSFRDTRFYYDGKFSEIQCKALYETWIEKSCNGYADTVLVAETERRAVGFIACHLVDDSAGQIGLVGVSGDASGQGFGQALVSGALRWFRGRNRGRAIVVTQGRNCKAQRLYQRCGFVTRSLQLWYHWWLPNGGA